MNQSATESVEVVAAAAVELSDVETFCVGTGDRRVRREVRIVVQAPLSGEYDDQDRRLEMDTYSISDNLGRTIYGGILAWSANSDASVLTVTFAQPVIDVLKVAETPRFHLPSDKFDEIVEGFRRVLAADERGLRP